MFVPIFLIVFSLAGCMARPVPVSVPVVVQIQAASVKVVAPVSAKLPTPPVPPPTGPAAVDAARLVLDEAAISLDRATDYVAWEHSTAPNIDRLTSLTRALRAALATLEAGRAAGGRSEADLDAARAALADLQHFLVSKGD